MHWEKISYIDYKKLFSYIFSPANIYNDWYDKSDEETSISNEYTEYSDNIRFVISNFWNQIGKRINTYYAVTGWMLCVIPHIREDVFKSAQNNNYIQVNNVIKTLFAGSTEKW